MARKRSLADLNPILTRVRMLAETTNLSAAEIRRMIEAGSDGATAETISYPTVQRTVRTIRSERNQTPIRTPEGMAERIMRLLSAELARIECQPGTMDLERLDRIAKTLRTLEPLRPKAGKERASSLRSLVEQQPEGLNGVRRREERIEDPSADDNVPSSQLR